MKKIDNLCGHSYEAVSIAVLRGSSVLAGGGRNWDFCFPASTTTFHGFVPGGNRADYGAMVMAAGHGDVFLFPVDSGMDIAPQRFFCGDGGARPAADGAIRHHGDRNYERRGIRQEAR